MPPPPGRQSAKTKILDAAPPVIRAKGYAATTVDDLCEAAGVTKGAFFHHFRSKDKLGVAPDIAADSVDYLRRYIEMLFGREPAARET